MNSSRLRNKLSMAFIGCLLAGAFSCVFIETGRPQTRPMKAAPTDPATLSPILGTTLAWNLTERRPGSVQVRESAGNTVFATESFPVTLTSRAALEAGSEISVRFRILPEENKNTAITLQTAIEDAANARDSGLYLSVSTRGEATTNVAWRTTNVDTSPGQKPAVSGAFATGFSATRSLGWPDGIRRQVEADLAAAETVAEHWFTLSIALREGEAEFAIDGIPLSKASRTGLKTSGFARLIVSPNVEVASVSVRKLADDNPLATYQPIDLHPVLNAHEVSGNRIVSKAPDGPVKVGTVPFELPRPGKHGANHVDVGKSWLRQGNLEGRYSGSRDAFGGRWPTALLRDPARIQLRVPKGRYRALHLLAFSDRDPDSVPIVTAQFYRPSAGFPVSFASSQVLALDTASALPSFDLKLEDGQTARLHHVVIPLDPGALAAFDDLDYLEMELTKPVQLYRAYPDPLFYSTHGAGLPSSVRVFAATLERPAVEVDLEAGAYAHIWTAPAKPNYTVKLRNRSGGARPVTLTLTTSSYIDKKITEQKKAVQLGAAGQDASTTFEITPPVYGYHDVKLSVSDGDQNYEEHRGLAYLREDTRERGDWDFGRGPMFGFWNWAGGHDTPSGEKQLLAMGQAGAETMHGSLNDKRINEATRQMAERFKIKTYKFAGAGDHYVTLNFATDLKNLGLEAAREKFLTTLRERQASEDKLNRPIFLSYYAEPSIGHHTHAIPPEYYGEPEAKFSPAEIDRYNFFHNGFVQGARIVRQNFPHVKNLLPHGDPNFPIPFLRRDPEVAKLIDGVTVDIPAFERLPEQQMHQVSVHRMYASRKEFARAGIEKPIYAMYEGPSIPSGPGSLSNRELADLSVRNSLILMGYGVDFQTGGFGGFDTASYWGEQHYGGGILNRIPIETPKPAYAAYATLTRNLNRSNFDGWTPTGSLTAYAQRYKHYKNGTVTHVLWTIRGERPVQIAAPAGTRVSVTDAMDNTTVITPQNGMVTFNLTSSPAYVTGLPANIDITLGKPDHADAQPAPVRTKLTNFGDGSWKQTSERDTAYEGSHEPYIVRFPGNMSIAPVSAPAQQGGSALTVHLGKQDKERLVMPYYTTLTPAKPILIPGKASHLGVWVKGASDWGRVVYSVIDAKGERWISVGKGGSWNSDDLHNWSVFNFDGWRYLNFEMPANSPYDSFREAGSTWWGSYSSGDNIIDLPLSLEKVLVERRTHAMYVNDPQPAKPDDVLLGDLFAEYSSAQDQGPEVVRLAALRMPVPTGVPDLDNPIEKMAQNNSGAPVKITEIKLPEQASDGTQTYVFFDKHPDAVTYDVWASPYPNGHGALQLAKNWKEPGGLARGFRPDTDFYLFVTYTDKDGKVSKPSAPFKIHLQDLFAQK